MQGREPLKPELERLVCSIVRGWDGVNWGALEPYMREAGYGDSRLPDVTQADVINVFVALGRKFVTFQVGNGQTHATHISGLLELRALSPGAAAVYEVLLEQPEYVALQGGELRRRVHETRQLNIEQSVLTSRIVPELQPYGIENEGKGYRINRRCARQSCSKVVATALHTT